jgi:antitoxin component YwqK of YwqJK toxin-antitoxin module
VVLETTGLCVIFQVEYDDDGQVRERYTLRNGLLDGLAQSYDEHGLLRKQAGYWAGQLHGALTLYGPPGMALFTLEAEEGPDLDQGTAVPPGVRADFQRQGIMLADDVPVTVEEPGREWTLTQAAHSYTIIQIGARLVVYVGRVVERASFEAGWLCARQRYAAGRLDGESTSYGPAGQSLFSLPSAYLPAIEAGDLAPLRPVFARVGIPLSAEVRVTAEPGGDEWLIAQADRTYSVRSGDQELVVYPGRLVQRQVFADGVIASSATFKDGCLEGTIRLFQAPSDPARLPNRAELSAIDGNEINRLNAAYGLDLSPQAQVSIEAAGLEWFIVDVARTFTIRRVGHQLGLFVGRAAQKASYHGGLRDGECRLYVAGWLAQSTTFRQGVPHGTTTIYSEGKKQIELDYSHGAQDGPAKIYDEQGQLTIASEYQAGLLQGWVRLYERGQPKAANQYWQGKRHGLAIAYFPNQQIQLLALYRQDQPHGPLTIYDQAGEVRERRFYRRGLAEGLALKYGSRKLPLEIAVYRADKRAGLYMQFNQSGRLIELCGSIDGQIRGIAVKYYPSGSKQEEAFYSTAGKLLGVTIYDENGTPLKPVTIDKAALPDGPMNVSGAKDTIATVLTYNQGALEGVFSVTDDDGKPLISGRFGKQPPESMKPPDIDISIYGPSRALETRMTIKAGKITSH